jgi:phospholipid/cholesterol/gamma-HCH transport system substrate-binding protein
MRKLAAGLAAVLVFGAGCTSTGVNGIYDLPLPGGADLGDHPYRVTVEFADVLDLVPQAAVKVNDVVVGRVEKIRLGGADHWTPQVVVAVNGDVKLPAAATASLRQSSLLGEKFVELTAPRGSDSSRQLRDGAVITADRTNRHTEVEEVFGALSLLLNGGGIGQIRTISQELTGALSGNEPEIRAFLANVDELVTNLDAHRGDITTALDGLNQLSTTLADRNDQIRGALTDLTPGLRSLTEQRTALVTMLQSLDTLSDVAVDTIDKSRKDMVADLEALAPILDQLAAAGENLPQALEILPTFPFTDELLKAKKGDYVNIFVTVRPDPNFQAPLPPLPIPGGG